MGAREAVQRDGQTSDFPGLVPRFQNPQPRKRILVSVVATVNGQRSEGKIRYVNPIPGGRLSGSSPRARFAPVKSEKARRCTTIRSGHVYTELTLEGTARAWLMRSSGQPAKHATSSWCR